MIQVPYNLYSMIQVYVHKDKVISGCLKTV